MTVPSLGATSPTILRADHAAGAVHVLHDHGRLAGDVLGEMLGEQPALDVGRPAGREVDQHREPLALVVGLLRGGAERCRSAQTTSAMHERKRMRRVFIGILRRSVLLLRHVARVGVDVVAHLAATPPSPCATCSAHVGRGLVLRHEFHDLHRLGGELLVVREPLDRAAQRLDRLARRARRQRDQPQQRRCSSRRACDRPPSSCAGRHRALDLAGRAAGTTGSSAPRAAAYGAGGSTISSYHTGIAMPVVTSCGTTTER